MFGVFSAALLKIS
jgi:hypothetical protein